jgi:MOSC domain-containing protein YiiM
MSVRVAKACAKTRGTMRPAHVLAVHLSPVHAFSKSMATAITLLAGLGVQGDAHCGETVQHRSRVARDPTQPNLRQVHLLQAELFEELAGQGHTVRPGDMGENITTRGIDLLALPTGTELRLGAAAVVRITGLRNPCAQIDRFQPGLMAAVLDRAPGGALVRKAGVMAVVLRGGVVAERDGIGVRLPAGPRLPLSPV